MSIFRFGYVTAPILGALWAITMAITVAVVLSFSTGDAFRPSIVLSIIWGALIGLAVLRADGERIAIAGAAVALLLITLAGFGPVLVGPEVSWFNTGLAGLASAVVIALPTAWILRSLPFGTLDRHEFEHSVIRFLTGFGYVFFTAIVLIPFYVMVMTSLKSQQALLANPLDFSLEFGKGWDLFRSYSELFGQFGFGRYLLISFVVSVATVFITLLFSVPGAYAVARLKFKGQAVMARSILLIYMVPMIVLALPIYIGFSMAGLRNSMIGIMLIYPVTTIPVALYMLAGLFPRAAGGG